MRSHYKLGLFIVLNFALYFWTLYKYPDIDWEFVDEMFDSIKEEMVELSNGSRSLDTTEGKIFVLSTRVFNLKSWANMKSGHYQRFSRDLNYFAILNCIMWVGLFVYVVTREKRDSDKETAVESSSS